MAETSLILTTYNRSAYLAAAIESVLAQTYSNFELIIWDDGSTDCSLQIAQQYARQDSRIRLVAAPHQGRVRSLKAAHVLAQGAYVGWLDSDDKLALTALEETVAILDAQPQVGMVYTNYQVIDSHERMTGLGKRCQIPYSRHGLLVDFMTFHFRLMRRSVYEQVGGVDTSFPCAMDYDLCLKISEVTHVHHLKRSLYFYRTHAQSISQQQHTQQAECAARAIRNAIVRRGLSDRLELEVQLPSRFFLKEKQLAAC